MAISQREVKQATATSINEMKMKYKYFNLLEVYDFTSSNMLWYIYVLHWKQCTYVQATGVTRFVKLALFSREW